MKKQQDILATTMAKATKLAGETETLSVHVYDGVKRIITLFNLTTCQTKTINQAEYKALRNFIGFNASDPLCFIMNVIGCKNELRTNKIDSLLAA